MKFERPMVWATPVVLVAALATFDANAQVPALRAADCGGGNSETSGEVVRVIHCKSLLFADGREVRFAAIETLLAVLGDEDQTRVAALMAAKTALETSAIHREISLHALGSRPDRYGRAYAFIQTLSDETLLQGERLAPGQALVSPAALAARCRTYLREAEGDARTGGLGLWDGPYYVVSQAVNPLDILEEQGRFALVDGRVTSVRENGGVIYVNFGQRWSEHFTLKILRRNEGIFAGAGLTPRALADRGIEVRGWIEQRGTPLMGAPRAGAA